MKPSKLTAFLAIVTVVAIVSLVAGFYLSSYRFGSTKTEPTVAAGKTTATENAANSQTAQNPGNQDNPFLSMITSGGESDPNAPSGPKALEIVVRLLLAVILSAVLAFRPRKNVPLFQRNLYVAQTQILLAVVAAALMLIVGDNTARAFAIFAAVSLVRFRTNIRDPKEITVLLISLALGLAAGVGRWELGLVLCLFVLGLLWLLEFKEPEKIFRSMELTVKTRNTSVTQEMLKKIFNANNLEAEVRQLAPEDEDDPIGSIVYFLNLRLNISTDRLSDKIFESDSANIEGISWKQQKGITYVQ